MVEETPWNKVCVDILAPYKIPRKRKEPLILKSITVIDPVTSWFEVTQYRDKKAMTIPKLVETVWLVWYPLPVEITYDWGGEFLGHEFKNRLIEKYFGIKTKPASPGNPQANSIVERRQQLLGNLERTYNLQETYVDDSDLWMGILAAEAFAVHSMYHRNKRKSPGQLFFGRDMILPINHLTDWRQISQHKQAQIDNDVIRENAKIIDHDSSVGDQVTTLIKSAYK